MLVTLDYPNVEVMYLLNWSENAGMLLSNSTVVVVDLLELEHYMSRLYDHGLNPMEKYMSDSFLSKRNLKKYVIQNISPISTNKSYIFSILPFYRVYIRNGISALFFQCIGLQIRIYSFSY